MLEQLALSCAVTHNSVSVLLMKSCTTWRTGSSGNSSKPGHGLEGLQTDGKPVAVSRRTLCSALVSNWPVTTKQLSHAPPPRQSPSPKGVTPGKVNATPSVSVPCGLGAAGALSFNVAPVPSS